MDCLFSPKAFSYLMLVQTANQKNEDKEDNKYPRAAK
jgi:hypothetical protein